MFRSVAISDAYVLGTNFISRCPNMAVKEAEADDLADELEENLQLQEEESKKKIKEKSSKTKHHLFKSANVSEYG